MSPFDFCGVCAFYFEASAKHQVRCYNNDGERDTSGDINIKSFRVSTVESVADIYRPAGV